MSKENQLIQCKLAWRTAPTQVVPLREVDEAVRKALDPEGRLFISRPRWYGEWNPMLVECLALGATWGELLQKTKDDMERLGGEHPRTETLKEMERLLVWFEANVVVSFVTRELTKEEMSDVMLTRLMCEALGISFDASAMVEALQAHPRRHVR